MNMMRRAVSVGLAMLVATVTFGQVEKKKSEAEVSFDKIKTLEGSWDGKVTVAEHPDMNNAAIHVSLRVTSMGNALVHEMYGEGRPDHPVTMVYMDGGQLVLTHYCDAGNRPRMAGKLLADGKTVEFSFLDVAGPMTYGHMHHAVFSAVDKDHHTEDWVFMEPGEKMAHAHMELTRAK